MAADTHGPVTRLINNAANDQRHATLEVDEAFWEWSIAINLKQYFFACQAVIPGMQAAGGGAIVHVDFGAAVEVGLVDVTDLSISGADAFESVFLKDIPDLTEASEFEP